MAMKGHNSYHRVAEAAMRRESDTRSVRTAATGRSIVTITDRRTLSIDMDQISTDMFPSLPNDNKTVSRATSYRTASISSSESILEKEPGTKALPVSNTPKFLTGAELYLVITSVIIVTWLIFLDTSIIVTAIPAITDEFHSLGDIGWYGSAYQLASAAIQPITGKIYRYFSTKWTYFTFVAIFELGSLICGAAPSSTVLIIGRVIAGVGSAGITTGGLTIIAGSVSLEKRPALMGLVIGLANTGSVFGPVLGGVITQYSTWRWAFYINLPIGGLALLLLLWTYIPDQLSKPRTMDVITNLHKYLDLVGFVLIAAAAVLLLLALDLGGGENSSFGSPAVIGLFSGSGVALIVFLVWNYRRGDDALIPPSMASRTPVWCAAATNFFMFGSSNVQVYALPLYFQAVQGVTPSRSGVNVLPLILSQLVTAAGGGLLVEKIGYYLPFAIGGTVATIIASGLLATLSLTTPVAEWVVFESLAGAGRGFVFQIPGIAVQANLPPDQISVGMSFITFTQFMGSAISLSIGNDIFSLSLRGALPGDAPNVDPALVTNGGATGFRQSVSPSDLPGVLTAYVSSINNELYLSMGLAALSFCFACGMGWKDIRLKKKAIPGSGS